MASYGRNFEFRVPPVHGERGGRYILGGSAAVPIGAPVKVANGATPSAAYTEALPVALATGAQAPKKGLCGILVYEVDPGSGIGGVDPVVTTYSDFSTAPVGKLVQVVSGTQAKVVLRNTSDRTFLQTTAYAGRLMVPVGSLAVGDFLTPGTGNDAAGYWVEDASAANAWLIVTSVNTARGEVEARLAF